MEDLNQDALSKIRQGEKKAFEHLFRNFYAPLTSYACRFLNDTEEAEEVVQDLFYNLWKNRERFHIEDSVKAYLYRAVRNTCINKTKHDKIKRAFADLNLQQINQDEKRTLDELEAKELAVLIEKGISEMPQERRKVFLMSREEGLKYREIAAELGISVKTVENQMGKALQHMREFLKAYLSVSLLVIENLIKYLI
ncbi:MAG: RNA polymerase sigma-70 factor [Cyclobacteriaceae bacterium]|nr:RNA polymerase sigma-70 factor [Cyclobacteriaceae bacterium]